MIKRVSIISWVFLYMVSFFTIVVTFYFKDYEYLLKIMTKENGFFESLSVLFLFTIFILGLNFILKNKKVDKIIKILVFLFSCLVFVAAMEEISWGQHIFNFQTNDFFKLHNYQKETNLHNLIDGNIFSSIIYSSVYTLFVFIPLFVYLLKDKIKILDTIYIYLPSFHVILVILYASSFQLYFYEDMGVIIDFITLVLGVILFIITLSLKKLWDKYIFIHFSYVLISIFIFMACYKIFSFYNMQYEIREMFVIFATLIYFIELSKKISGLYKQNTHQNF